MRLAVLALLFIGLPSLAGAGYLVRSRRRQGPVPRGALVSGWLSHRRALRLENTRHHNGMLRDAARHWQRMREHEARERARNRARPGGTPAGDAAPGGAPADDPPPRWRATVTHVWSRWHPAGDETGPGRGPAGAVTPPPGDPGSPDRPSHPDNPDDSPRSSRPSSPKPPAQGGGDSPSHDRRPAPGHPVPVLEGTVVTVMPDHPEALAIPGLEMIIEGANALRRHAMSGNARAKRRAILGIAAAHDCLAGAERALSRDMAEPGQHYGPEVTEPLAVAATHSTAASLTLSEVDGRLSAIIAAAEELRARGVQAPHHEQMAEQ